MKPTYEFKSHDAMVSSVLGLEGDTARLDDGAWYRKVGGTWVPSERPKSLPEELASIRGSVESIERWVKLKQRPASVIADAFKVLELGEVLRVITHDREGVERKLHEEVGELLSAKTLDHAEEELGDVLLVLCRFANMYGLDPENALGRSVQKMKERLELCSSFALENPGWSPRKAYQEAKRRHKEAQEV